MHVDTSTQTESAAGEQWVRSGRQRRPLRPKPEQDELESGGLRLDFIRDIEERLNGRQESV